MIARLTGEVVHGDKMGRVLGYPTANLADDATIEGEAKDGVYAAWVTLPDGTRNPAAATLGIDGKREAHLLYWSGDLYGQIITVELVSFVRPLAAFVGLGPLKEAIAADLVEIRKRLSLP